MKILIRLICCMIIMYSAHHATAQNTDDWYGTYSFTLPKPSGDTLFNNDEDMEFLLRLNTTHQYTIGISRKWSEDVVWAETISGGSFSVKQDTLYCKDSLFRYTLKAIKRGDSLQFLNGFHFFKNRWIAKYDTSNLLYDALYGLPIINYRFILSSIAGVKNHNYPKIEPGEYSNPVFRLMLYRNKHYRWEIMSQSISEGKWSQKGNIVTLMDTDIDFPFNALVDSNGLRSMLLPGDYQGTVLTRKIKK